MSKSQYEIGDLVSYCGKYLGIITHIRNYDAPPSPLLNIHFFGLGGKWSSAPFLDYELEKVSNDRI